MSALTYVLMDATSQRQHNVRQQMDVQLILSELARIHVNSTLMKQNAATLMDVHLMVTATTSKWKIRSVPELHEKIALNRHSTAHS